MTVRIVQTHNLIQNDATDHPIILVLDLFIYLRLMMRMMMIIMKMMYFTYVRRCTYHKYITIFFLRKKMANNDEDDEITNTTTKKYIYVMMKKSCGMKWNETTLSKNWLTIHQSNEYVHCWVCSLLAMICVFVYYLYTN